MSLHLQLKIKPSCCIDASQLLPDSLTDCTPEDVARLKVWLGRQSVEVGEIFDISGSANDGVVEFHGDCSHINRIGERMQSGQIVVHGTAGSHLGASMTGGKIRVNGNVGNWAGAEMRAGRIEIFGNAGDQVSGAYPGSKKGMRGGEILIHGNAGNELGVRQRRGLVAVAGDVAAGCGYDMIAGTILVGGHIGHAVGIGMKRGSIILLSADSSDKVPLTFRPALTTRLTFLPLYFRHLNRLGFPIDAALSDAPYVMYRGDLTNRGLGEILCRAHSG